MSESLHNTRLAREVLKVFHSCKTKGKRSLSMEDVYKMKKEFSRTAIKKAMLCLIRESEITLSAESSNEWRFELLNNTNTSGLNHTDKGEQNMSPIATHDTQATMRSGSTNAPGYTQNGHKSKKEKKKDRKTMKAAEKQYTIIEVDSAAIESTRSVITGWGVELSEEAARILRERLFKRPLSSIMKDMEFRKSPFRSLNKSAVRTIVKEQLLNLTKFHGPKYKGWKLKKIRKDPVMMEVICLTLQMAGLITGQSTDPSGKLFKK